jgi:hypothetical protein
MLNQLHHWTVSLDNLVEIVFTKDEIDTSKRVRNFQQNVGKLLEDYINTKLTDNIVFVGRDSLRPEGVDYIVEGVHWSVKNAWNTDNHSMKKYREDRNINHWYRLNKDGTTNWNTLFLMGGSENEFIEYVTGTNQFASLDSFFG